MEFAATAEGFEGCVLLASGLCEKDLLWLPVAFIAASCGRGEKENDLDDTFSLFWTPGFLLLY